MMKDKKKEGKLSDNEMNAKKSVLEEIREMASGAMGDKVKGVKQVSVMAKDQSGLEKGLDKAKQLVSGKDESDPEMEGLEEDSHEDLDHDNEDDESSDHADKVLGHDGSPEEASMSSDDIDAQIEKLMKLKAMKKGLV